MSDFSPAEKLLEAVREGNVSTQTVLLVGADNTERHRVANELVATWLGRDAALALDSVVDLMTIDPEGASSWIKKGVIVPDKVNPQPNIRTFIRTVPLMWRTKVVWMRRPERITNDSFNTLLKMIEEPPPYVRFIFTTDSLTGIAQTIISRCLVIACRPEVSDGDWTPLETLFCEGSLERRALMRAKPAGYAALAEFFEELPSWRPSAGLKASERFRALTDGLPGSTARENNTEGLRLLGAWLRTTSAHPRIGAELAETHRRILGNGNAGIQLDPFFCQLLRENLQSGTTWRASAVH